MNDTTPTNDPRSQESGADTGAVGTRCINRRGRFFVVVCIARAVLRRYMSIVMVLLEFPTLVGWDVFSLLPLLLGVSKKKIDKELREPPCDDVSVFLVSCRWICGGRGDGYI